MNNNATGLLVLVCAIGLAVPGRSSGADEPTGLRNLDFEKGKDGWAVWYSDDPRYLGPRFDWSIDSEPRRSGLRIVADDRRGRIFVHQSTRQFAKGSRYQLSYWVKFSSQAMYEHCAVTVNLAKPRREGKGRDLVQINPVTFYKRGDNGWLHRTGFFMVDKDAEELQIGLSVKNTIGTVWFDDIRLSVVPAGEIRLKSMHDYAPGQVDLGPDMVKRFDDLRLKKSGFLERAKVYNRLLVETANLADELHQLVRMAFYLEAHGKSPTVQAEQDAVAQVEKQLDGLYLAYGHSFKERQEGGLEAFDRAARELSPRIATVRRQLIDRSKALQATARDLGLRWTALPMPSERELAIAPSGQPNQLIFGTVSLQSHYELEEPLGINRLFASSIFEAKGEGPGKYDFSDLLRSWDFYKKLGVQKSSIGTAFAVHSNQMVPSWFLKKYANDDDIFCVAADGKKALRPSWSTGAPLNTWRPEVRDMTADLIAQIGKTFRSQPQYLFYVVAPENGGPYFPSESDVKSIGYNKSALADFRAWLKRRYGTIEALNRQWKTSHPSFEAIQAPPDLLIVDEWPRPHPLAYEFQTWRNDHHHHWLKFLYDESKKADPTKPVMADHSALLCQIDGSRIFDTADIVSVHHAPQLTPTLAPLYVYSMNRFAKKHLAQYENGWGFAEPMPHHASEVEQRAALTKYLYRLTAWGMHTQMWWYAYTSNDYMIQFNGNWFNPVYDLTTLRYSAAGLPAAKARVKRLEDVLLKATIQPSRVVLMQPVTSMLFQSYWNESFVEMDRLHELLYERNDLHEILPETFFTDGRARLNDYDVVVLPYALYLPDKLADQLRDWVRKGGTLVALGPFGLYDPFGFDRANLWTEVIGKPLPTRFTKPFRYWDRYREFRWGWDEKQSEEPVLEKAFGAGRVIVAMRSLRSPAMAGAPSARLVAAIEAKARRAASCPSNQFEMTIHEAPDGKKYLCAINVNTAKPVTDTVTLAGAFSSGVDVAVPGGFPVAFKTERGGAVFTLRLEPGGLAYIELRN